MKNSTSESQQRLRKLELADLLEEKIKRQKQNPLKYARQHEKQKEASQSLKAIRALFWGNRVGKSQWGAQEVVKYALGEHEYREIVPPVHIWCACPSYDAQRETTQLKIESYLPDDSIADITYVKKNTWGEIRLKNGSIIAFKSYEQGREKFQGVGKRLIWFDEEPPLDIWEECFVRQEAGVQLDIILTMTAVKGMTWIYDRIYLDTSNPDLFISEAGWDDNPWLEEGQKIQMSRGLTAEALKVRRDGKFTRRVGLVCNWWNREKHLRDYAVRNRAWNWYEVLDGGFSDPACWLLLGVDGDNNVHIVDGFREPGLSAADIKAKRDIKVSGLPISGGWIDNDDSRLKTDLYNLGMELQSVKKIPGDSKNWDETLSEKLNEYGAIQKGTGEPRLYVSNSLVGIDEKTGDPRNWFVQEIENLVWLEIKRTGEFEQKPVWDDHRRFGHHFDGMRALSYFLISYMKEENTNDSYAVQLPVRFDPYSR